MSEIRIPEGRWGRLMTDLAAAGFAPRLDEKPYQEIYCGRARSGISRSITIPVPDRGCVSIADKWWNKNPGKWVGWEVCAEDAEGIMIGRPARWTKNRGDVVIAVREMFARIGR